MRHCRNGFQDSLIPCLVRRILSETPEPRRRGGKISKEPILISFFQCSKSTDFEVHRNWLAITHSLPVKDWYYEKTSEWTLDYPPCFAIFEWLLSQAARYADPAMLVVSNLNYDSWQTVYFQRATVILTEFVLVYALSRYIKSVHPSNKHLAHIASLSILLSPGLLIIDHIHFQYNGFLYGILILSIVLARKQSTLLLSGITFAILICLKHIYLYLALAYFVYLLRAYCLDPKSFFRPQFANIFKLGVCIVGIFAIAFGPFLQMGQLLQLKDRLFPFSRGLCHAYWAPNIWAMYSFTDRVLIQLAPRLGLTVNQEALASVTRGLVGDSSFAVLPEVTKEHTFILTLLFQLLPLVKLWLRPDWDTFVGAITLCGYASFLFGWHVHEKAVLLIIIPFSLIALKDRRYFSAFRPLAVAGHVSLFPLLFTAAEFPIKTVYTILWLILFLFVFDQVAPVPERPRIFLADRFSLLYHTVAIPLIVYCSLIHQLIFGLGRLEFLPLMFMSSYSALGVVGSWVGFMVVYFTA
ncbi:dolichyl-P-Glc:Glc1Man(9)GlcNAc(2)-PP-dolichol alpha-1,3-glucosyltransferase ALG8 [Aspergillus affinis]|uniref:dolichyl-P-Glc:Glc1Man(9)GlcNAc(2)-PP-dolichol alpha-1,3-glucosyltransferase ALG8 n=1 Tax=Aspergillus affinis TaxID=1070780 RepID=UPI0022FEBAFE|nr:ALG6 [Aspergillus affinis]KAI9037838.1 ALG6 [Aspergillus affinis]